MLKYNIISAVCFIMLVGMLAYVIFKFFKLDRKERIEFIRTFKKGKCLIVYFAVLPLYVVGRMFDGELFYQAFFGSIYNIVRLVVLQYELKPVQSLMNASWLYKAVILFSYAIVGLNALMFTISLTHQKSWQSKVKRRFIKGKGEKVVIIGNSKSALSVYESCEKENKILLEAFTDDESYNLYLQNVKHVDVKDNYGIIRLIEKNQNLLKQKLNVIISTENEQKNLSICQAFVDYVNGENDNNLLLSLSVFVFGSPKYENVYQSLEKNSKGCLHFVNKYEQIAVDFVDKYPFAKFMGEDKLDYSLGVVKQGVEINVSLIGFGKTNQHLFLTSLSNNQFIQKTENGFGLKPVNYYIFDKNDVKEKNFNHSYYRYKNEVDMDRQADYLPFPAQPATTDFHKLDVNDVDFYNDVKNIVTKNQTDANFIVIAFGQDMENLDLANMLIQKCREWQIKNVKIFVKIRNKAMASYAKSLLQIDKNQINHNLCFIFATEDQVVFNYDKIVNEKLERMARLRSAVYSIEYDFTTNDNLVVSDAYVDQVYKKSLIDWYVKNGPMERLSNVYCVLSLRSKLNLFGFDYVVKSEEGEAVGYDEYIKKYGFGDMPNVEKYNAKVLDKPIVYYPSKYIPSLRGAMAELEHFRWNSFMISRGFIPSTISQIESEMVEKNGKMVNSNGKNYDLRRHGNLTTFEGLVQFAEIICKRDNKTLEQVDVRKYDYQILDDAYWLLDKAGYKIIKK